MISENARNYENVVIRNEQEIGINNFGLDYMVGLEEEIERLNNIINELEKFLKDKIDSWKKQNDDEIVKDTIYHERLAVRLIYDYLQELKGSDSNECI